MKKITYRRPQLVPILFIIGATALLIGLGCWQLSRLAWKETLMRQIEAAEAQAALTRLPADTHGLEYRKATLSGRFLYDHSLHMIGRRSQGYLLLTPFQLSDGRYVLVNRGWAPNERLADRGPEQMTIEGILRAPQRRRLFSPDNDARRNIWFIEDMPAMEAATGVSLLPIILEMTGPKAADDIPEVSNGIAPLRNDHLGYAITWFLLAGIGLAMFVVYHREVAHVPSTR